MSLQDIQAKTLTYVGMQGREAQDSYMLYSFLIESLMDSSKAQMLLYENDRIPSTTPGADPPRDARDSGSAKSH